MAEGVDGVEGVLITEIAPTSKPRDTDGKYVRETTRPEPMFSDREIEGDPLTGDTSDAGDDPVLRAREREISDGYERDGEASSKEKRSRDESSRSRSKRDGHSDADDGSKHKIPKTRMATTPTGTKSPSMVKNKKSR